MNKFVVVVFLLISIAVSAQNTDIINLYNKGDYSRVIQYADSLIQKQAADENLWLHKGLSEQALFQYPKAVKSFLQVCKLNPQTENQLLLANAWEHAGNDDKATEIYTRILQSDSTNVLAMARKASIYKSQHEYLKAVELYSNLVKQDSTNGYFYYQLGYCASKLGLTEPAASYFFDAYKLNTADFKSVKGYLGELVKQKRYMQAENYIDSFLYVFPDNLYLLKQQAFLFAIGGSYLDAVNGFKKVTEMGDSTMFTCKYYGQSLYNNGNYDEAVVWLEKYLKSNIEDAKNHFIIGLAYQKDYQYKKSLDSFDKVGDIIYNKKNIAQLYEERANTYIAYGDYYGFRDSTGIMKKKNYDLALQCFLKAEEYYPQNYTIYKNLGQFYDYKLHDNTIALYYYQLYYDKLNPKAIKVWELQWIQDKIGELKEEIHFSGE